MPKLYEMVIAKSNLERVPQGTKGTILIVYNMEHYEVEFADEEGKTLNVLTVSKYEIEDAITKED